MDHEKLVIIQAISLLIKTLSAQIITCRIKSLAALAALLHSPLCCTRFYISYSIGPRPRPYSRRGVNKLLLLPRPSFLPALDASYAALNVSIFCATCTSSPSV
mmetsp:Transcript_68979/g.114627  ORF Transcript_68979/g.114627 Transcript_68979/m.114627 type:complete len:103 (-) Transcript_68979:288-596(-)